MAAKEFYIINNKARRS